MCAPMGLWLSTSVGPFCPAHLDGASYANEIPQNGPPAVIVQSDRGWNHPFGVVFFSADPFKGKERYRKVSLFWLCCNTADWGRGTWAYLASCSHSIWWLSYFNRCRTQVTLLAVRNWNLRCLYIYIYRSIGSIGGCVRTALCSYSVVACQATNCSPLWLPWGVQHVFSTKAGYPVFSGRPMRRWYLIKVSTAKDSKASAASHNQSSWKIGEY